jgi:uncharacterized protein YceK
MKNRIIFVAISLLALLSGCASGNSQTASSISGKKESTLVESSALTKYIESEPDEIKSELTLPLTENSSGKVMIQTFQKI